MKRVLLIPCVLVLAFGMGCLNYTTDGQADHHREWAPPPGLADPSPDLPRWTAGVEAQ